MGAPTVRVLLGGDVRVCVADEEDRRNQAEGCDRCAADPDEGARCDGGGEETG